MQNSLNLFDIQKKLGHVFRNTELLEKAFEDKTSENRLRLSFLGKNLLTAVISDYIYTHTPPGTSISPEKDLLYFLSAIETGKFLRSKDLIKYIPQASESRPENEVSTDVFYAVVAAIYLDSGMTALKSFTLPLIRSCDSESHYERGAEGKVLTADMPTEETAQDGVHIQNARRGRRSGATSLGITRALTVNKNEPVKNSEKNTQVKAKTDALDKSESDGTTKTVKSSGLSGLFSLRGRKKKQLPETSEESDSEEKITPEPTVKRSFIRDALTPVRLSDELRNAGYRKPKSSASVKTDVPETDRKVGNIPSDTEIFKENSESAQRKNRKSDLSPKSGETENSGVEIKSGLRQSKKNAVGFKSGSTEEITANTLKQKYPKTGDGNFKFSSNEKQIPDLETKTFSAEKESGNENFKSMLQEAVQKIIRTSNMILKYSTVSDKKGGYNCKITAEDREIASASASGRKAAEQLAAKNAYNLLQKKDGPEFLYLHQLAKSGTLSSEGPDDFVSKVNRYFQKNYKNSKLPTYMKKDSDSKKTFTVAVIFDGKELAEASAPSLKQAKQLAAEKVCKQFGIQ